MPKIPSYRILDLVESIAPELKCKIIGIRPGEKLHEEMITETDALNTLKFKDHFVILPSTHLWDIEKFAKESNSSVGQECEYGFSYNSETNEHFLTVDELRQMIQSNIQ